VAAGSGRITFDGGLAARVGPEGQLLLTDPSAAQIQNARKHAHELGLDWVRLLQAPVEDLPLASGTVDLVLGSTFLHFTDPAVAIKAMARLVRPGGRVAVHAIAETVMGDGWQWALEPVREEPRTRGLSLRELFASQAELEQAFAGASLQLDAVVESRETLATIPSVEIAIGMLRQAGLVALYLRGVPVERQRAVDALFAGRLRERFGESGMDWSWGSGWSSLAGHKPQ